VPRLKCRRVGLSAVVLAEDGSGLLAPIPHAKCRSAVILRVATDVCESMRLHEARLSEH